MNFEQRLEVCKQCPYFNSYLKTCRKCGCILMIKTMFKSAKCPIGKW